VSKFVESEFELKENKGLRAVEPLASTLLYLPTERLADDPEDSFKPGGGDPNNVDQDPFS
jgi:hypothetical protein